MKAAPDAILARLLDLHPKKIDLSLGRTCELLAKLGDPQRSLPPTIHVAGTNGKGSTIAFMRAMLEASGRRAHVYTSPHLVRFNERIRLAGALVDDERLSEALEICEQANAGAPITFFEITTAAAFLLFAREPADVLLLEVGLGGRSDSTNVIEAPAACVITPVSFDHPEFLGDTVEKIAFEKAGIFKPGAPAILAPQSAGALRVLEREARRRTSDIAIANEDYHCREENGRLIYEDERGLLDLPPPRLVGRHQYDNAGTAIATLRRLHPEFAPEIFARGLAQAQWPARLQHLPRGPLAELGPEGGELWLDGGHNEDGGRALAQAMADLEERRPRALVLICGTLASKDTQGFLRAFKGLAQEVIAVPVNGEHASRSAAEVAQAAQAVGLPSAACADFEDALRFLHAREWPAPPRILIAGSLYLAGEVLRVNGARLD